MFTDEELEAIERAINWHVRTYPAPEYGDDPEHYDELMDGNFAILKKIAQLKRARSRLKNNVS